MWRFNIPNFSSDACKVFYNLSYSPKFLQSYIRRKANYEGTERLGEYEKCFCIFRKVSNLASLLSKTGSSVRLTLMSLSNNCLFQ